MAGHSKFANIKHRKGAQDKKRAKIFTRLGREIIVAARSGPDPDMNPALRNAIIAARAQNMPKDKIEAAIKKGSGNSDDAENYEEARYEGYGPGGIAVIVDCLTDNKNRTVTEVRTAFSKNGGSLGEAGSVGFMFERVGLIQYPAEKAEADAMFETAAEVGAQDVESDEEWHNVYCDVDAFSDVRDGLIEKFGDPEEARLSWRPTNYTEVDENTGSTLLKLIDALEESDDVQYVTTNADIPDEVMEKLDA